MSVEHVEILVEEPSAEAILRALISKLPGDCSFQIHPHQGKADLLKKLPDRLRAYDKWIRKDTWRILVLVDRDQEECHRLKARLEKIAAKAGLTTRSRSRGGSYVVVNRLAIEEIEAWCFGDWEAVRMAYPRVSATISSQARYRDPDAIAGGTWEAFERVLRKYEYFSAGLAKIEAAIAIGRHMVRKRNSSRSFQVLWDALAEMAST
jgi:hypothetical protein